MITVYGDSPGRSRSIEVACGAGVAAFAAALVIKLGDVDNIVKATLLLVLVGVGVTVLRRPRQLLALVAIAAPFNYSVTLIGFQVGTNDLLLFSAAAILLPKIRISATPSWLRLGVAAVVVGTGAAAVLANDPQIAAYGCLRYTAAGVLLLASVSQIPVGNESVRRFGLIISLSSLVVVAGALLQRSGVHAPPLGAPFSPDRLDSTFGYYTPYAGFMALALVISVAGLSDAIHRSSRSHMLSFGAGAAAAGVGLGLSLSRGAIAAAAVGLGVVALLQIRRPAGMLGVLTISLVVAGGAWLTTPVDYREAFIERLTTDQGGDNTRVVLQRTGWQAAAREPLGLGYGNFPDYLERYDRSPEVSLPFFHAHRTPTEFALDGGWIGFGGFALLFIVPLALVARRWRSRSLEPIGAGAAAAVVVFLVQGWNDYLLYETAFVVLSFGLVWAAYACAQGLGVGDGPIADVHGPSAAIGRVAPCR